MTVPGDITSYLIGGGLLVLTVALVLLARRFQVDISSMRGRRDLEGGSAEPSRSVLLDSPPDLRPAAVEEGEAPSSAHSWISEFSDSAFERPVRPSIDRPSLPLAQMPTHSSLQVPMPPPLHPSPPPMPAPLTAGDSAGANVPEPPEAEPLRRGRFDWVTLGSFALGVALALWATVATFMLATRPEVDRAAVDAQIAALETRVDALSAQVQQSGLAPTPPAIVGQTSTPEAGPPPAETEPPTATPTPAVPPLTTPEAVETVAPELSPTPPTATQALETEEPAEEPLEEAPVAGGETWSLGQNGERVYFAGPGGGPLDTAGQDLYDCHNFETWAQALAVREASGPGDPNLIDTDGNGLPCESLRDREQAG